MSAAALLGFVLALPIVLIAGLAAYVFALKRALNR